MYTAVCEGMGRTGLGWEGVWGRQLRSEYMGKVEGGGVVKTIVYVLFVVSLLLLCVITVPSSNRTIYLEPHNSPVLREVLLVCSHPTDQS